MANKKGAGETPANVADIATEPKALDHRGLALIGVTGNAGAFRALVRLPSGRVKQVEPGEKLAAGQVVAIDETGLMLQKNGRTKRLAMPGG